MASVTRRKWTRGNKASESWQVSWIEEGRQRKKSGFRTKREADTWATDKEKGLNDRTSRPAAHLITVQDLAMKFIGYEAERAKRGVISEGHVINIQGHLYNYIARPTNWTPRRADTQTSKSGKFALTFDRALTSMTLDKVGPRVIRDFRDSLFRLGLNHQTVRAIIVTTHSMFEYARQEEMIASNPASRIKIEVPREMRDQRVTPPSYDHIREVLSAADDETYSCVWFSAATGLRAGELRGLVYGDFDTQRRVVNIERALNGMKKIVPPKSGAGVRAIPLANAVIEHIEARRIATGSSPTSLVYPGVQSTYLGNGTLLQRLKRTFDRLGWEQSDERRFRWHSLRHFAISNWIAEGLGLKAVQTFAGHKDIQMTWNRYGHLFPRDDHWGMIEASMARLQVEAN